MILHACRLLLAALLIVPTAFAAESPLVLGVHPYLPPKEIQERFAPLAAHLGKALDRPVVVRVGRDYDEHITAIGKDQIDIAFLGPTSYVTLVKSFGPKPLLARLEVSGKPRLIGVIVTRQDSPLRKLSALKGKRFAFGDPQSTMGHTVPQRMLEQAGVPEKALASHKFLGAHKNVVLGVLAGDYDAGAVKSEVYDEYANQGLRVLATSPPVSEHLFVTRGNMPPDQIELIRRTLLTLKPAPNGLAILHAINKDATNLVPVRDDDYDGLRQILFGKGKWPGTPP
jgi:phosphonate transport system substrate-binding protein